MMTITWVPKRDRKPKFARWAVLQRGARVAYFQKLSDAIDFVANPPKYALEEV